MSAAPGLPLALRDPAQGVHGLLPAGQGGPRYLVAWLPAWSLERCGWTAATPAVVVAERRNATRVVALTPAVAAEGLAPGMTVAEARARVHGLVVERLDEGGEAEDREALVASLTRFGERVAAWGPEAVVIETSAVTGWFGGEEALMARLQERLVELGHEARLALADHPRAAHALAVHASAPTLVPPGEGAAALAGLPFAALQPSEELAASVRALGLRTVGDWAGLDAASVAGRFGEEGLTLHRVARGGLGPPWASLPRPGPRERLRLPVDDELVQVDEVLASVEPGLRRLRDQLAGRDLVAAALELRLELSWGPSVRVRLRVARPTRDPEVLLRLLGDRLSRTPLEAPVTGLLLHASEVAPDGQGQQDLLDRREQAGAWSELVARLGDVLGEQALAIAALREAWAPEAAWVPCRLGEAAPVPPGVADDPVERQEGAAWHAERPRPTLLRSPPLPLRVRARGGRPVAVGVRDGWSPVRRARGPEHLEGAWWTPTGGFARAYWVAELPEGLAWLFQERSQWFLHGWF
ncbi:MAG: DNA polymerase Y family protein [Alphaproteobacteria bacterium]|nr:DNA polymerase Y family protein [Alphaproteobacteria bacterium]